MTSAHPSKTREPPVEDAGRSTPVRSEDASRPIPVGREARSRLLEGLPVMERRIDVAGVSTVVLEGGEGPPMVLLHGPGEHATKWLRVIPSLVEDFHVVAPDLPGHGASRMAEDAVGPERVVAWLDGLIEETCSTPPVLVGQIIGGAIAARYAAVRGDRLRRLVLADALGLAPFQPTPEFGQALGEFVAHPTQETHDRLWARCAFDLDRLRAGMGDKWDALKAYNLDRARVPSLGAVQGSLMEQFGFPAIPDAELARISVDTALVWGRHDLATRLEVAEAASRAYGWPLHVIEDAADDPAIEQPEAFVAVLKGIVDSS